LNYILASDSAKVQCRISAGLKFKFALGANLNYKLALGVFPYGLGENTDDPASSATTSTSVAVGLM